MVASAHDASTELMSRMDTADIALWSDVKKDEFCNLLDGRVRASQFIIRSTVNILLKTAEERHFISQKHLRKFQSNPRSYHSHHVCSTSDLNDKGSYHHVGDRSVNTLNEIAHERASGILRDLPPLAKVVEVIDTETSSRIRRKEKLIADCEVLREELAEVCSSISMKAMAEEKPDTTLVQFLAYVEERNEKRLSLVKKLNKNIEEGKRLEEAIAKALYRGLPGLSEAIVEVADNLIAQDKSLDNMSRRITEKVKFGDSEAALEILQHFEQDEAEVKTEVRAKFDAAIASLKIPKPKRSKKAKAS